MKGIVCFTIFVCFMLSSIVNAEEEEENHGPIDYVVTSEAWFDIVIKETKDSNEVLRKGRVVIGLFGDICPMTTTNFIQLAKGFKREGTKFSFKGSPVHRIVKDFVIQMGDIINHDGTGSKSIYGDKFIDENFILSHRSPGWVSMANYGADTNGSQFFITLVPARWLDGHHVVFGRVLSGMSFVREISETQTYKGTSSPKKYIEIVDCGTKDVNRYELTEDQVDSPGDAKSD